MPQLCIFPNELPVDIWYAEIANLDVPKKLPQVRSLQKAGPCWPQAGKILLSQRRSDNVRSAIAEYQT